MKLKTIAALFALMTVAACGPGPQKNSAVQPPAASVSAPIATPEHDSTGVIAAVDGLTVTLDHEGSVPADLAPGRSTFTLYGDVAAEAPLTPGARVAFTYRKAGAGLELTALKAR